MSKTLQYIDNILGYIVKRTNLNLCSIKEYAHHPDLFTDKTIMDMLILKLTTLRSDIRRLKAHEITDGPKAIPTLNSNEDKAAYLKARNKIKRRMTSGISGVINALSDSTCERPYLDLLYTMGNGSVAKYDALLTLLVDIQNDPCDALGIPAIHEGIKVMQEEEDILGSKFFRYVKKNHVYLSSVIAHRKKTLAKYQAVVDTLREINHDAGLTIPLHHALIVEWDKGNEYNSTLWYYLDGHYEEVVRELAMLSDVETET